MATPLSAGVYIEERDMSNNVVATATNVGAYVGRSVWGPPMTRTLISSEKDFATLFGEPTDTNYEHFFTTAGFLKYGNALYYVRAVNEASAKNSQLNSFVLGVSAGAGDYIKDWEDYTPTFTTEKFQFFAKYPGAKGNTDIKVALINYTAYAALTADINDPLYAEVSGLMSSIEYGPTDSTEYVVVVKVLSEGGVATVSTDFEIAETFLISDTEGTKDNFGDSMYIEQLINTSSNYILAFNNTSVTAQTDFFDYTVLAGGSDGTDSAADIVNGYDLFANAEEIEINYLIGGANNSASQAISISTLAQTRKDCISLHDVEKSDVVNQTAINATANVVSFRTSDLSALNTSYSALYANWLYVYDKYNDKNRWVPSTGYVAGIYANTANISEAWFAPAGFNRGVLVGVIKTAFNPDKTQRDSMYQKQVNPIVNFPGQGIVVWGQKTLQTKPSSFDRVNVRLLFLYMEKSIAKSAQYMVWEQNDNLLRAIFLNMVEPFLTNIRGRRGVYDFLVDVGDKVNTPEVIDANEFHAEIYVKPTRVAEAIKIRFNATKTSVNFSEIA